MNTPNYIVAIEIGSSKIKGAVGLADPAGTLTVKGIEEEHQHPNYVRYGCVQNIKEVANELNRVIAKLNNRISPEKITAAYVGVGGRSLRTSSARLTLSLADDTEVTPEIVAKLLSRARIAEPDRDLLDVEAVSFQVDGKEQGADPVGILGRDIAAQVNIVNCRSQIIRNLQKVLTEKLDLKVNGYVVRPMALADMVLTSEEKRLGVMMVDCGAETTTVAIYRKGTLAYLSTIPLGSRHITRDIAASTPCLEERAEELKRTVGNASGTPDDSDYSQITGQVNGQINGIVSARALEVIVNVNAQLEYAGLTAADVPGGIVVAGGGAMLQGFAEELEKYTSLSVRRGSLPPTVRISGSKISTGEDLDVISLLYRLSSEVNLKPCTVAPAPVKEEQPQVVVEEQPRVTVTPATKDDEYAFGSEVEEEVEDKPKRKGRSWREVVQKIRSSFKPADDLGNFDEE